MHITTWDFSKSFAKKTLSIRLLLISTGFSFKCPKGGTSQFTSKGAGVLKGKNHAQLFFPRWVTDLHAIASQHGTLAYSLSRTMLLANFVLPSN